MTFWLVLYLIVVPAALFLTGATVALVVDGARGAALALAGPLAWYVLMYALSTVTRG